MKKTLIYDLEIEGHHSEFINNIVDHLKRMNKDDDYFIATKFNLEEANSVLFEKLNSIKNVTFIPISQEEFDFAFEPYLSVKRSYREFRLVKKIAQQVEANSIILLHLNVFQTSINFFNRISKSVLSISGIYFHPFYRMEVSNLKDKLNYFRRFIQMKLLLSSQKLDSVFVLNDSKTVLGLNKIYKTEKFKLLLDPIVPYNEALYQESDWVRRKHQIEKDSKVFIFLGHLSERKGIISALEAFLLLDAELAKQSSLLILGIPEKQIKDAIEARIEELKTSPLSKVVYCPSFLEESQMVQYFMESDIVLMPYLKSIGSSGIMGHAAQAKKILIGPDFGLLGELIETYNLGITTDTKNIEQLVKTIEQSINFPIKESHRKGMSKYIEERSPEIFSKTLLEK